MTPFGFAVFGVVVAAVLFGMLVLGMRLRLFQPATKITSPWTRR